MTAAVGSIHDVEVELEPDGLYRASIRFTAINSSEVPAGWQIPHHRVKMALQALLGEEEGE